jgi:chromosome segregation ATPase
MNALNRRLAWLGGAIVTIGCTAVVLAQGRNTAPDTSGSLAPLTEEIRQLRLAVEESARSQAQTQALGVYLSVQQSRLLQLATRLDAARKDLDTATARSNQIATTLTSVEDTLPRVTELQERGALESEIRALKQERVRVGTAEQQARTREAELSQAMQLEDARWSDLISRLELLIKR